MRTFNHQQPACYVKEICVSASACRLRNICAVLEFAKSEQFITCVIAPMPSCCISLGSPILYVFVADCETDSILLCFKMLEAHAALASVECLAHWAAQLHISISISWH